MAVNGQFPTLVPAFYPGSKATDPRPFASLDGMWIACFHPPLTLIPSEKTGGFASTATKSTTPSSIVGILSILRAVVWTVNLTNLATMTHTDVGKNAWSATAETGNLLARTTTRKIVAIIQVNCEGTTRIMASKPSQR